MGIVVTVVGGEPMRLSNGIGTAKKFKAVNISFGFHTASTQID
jgi:hypothetical protein